MDRKNQQGIVYLVPLLILFLAAGFFLTTVNRSNVADLKSSVLSSSDDSGSDNSGSDNSGSGKDETKVESENTRQEDSKDDNRDEVENENEKSDDGDKAEVETESEFEDKADEVNGFKNRVHTRVKYTSKGELEQELDIRNSEGRFKLRTENGVNRLIVKQENGEETESRVSFRSNFPVSVDPTTGVLTITTPKGEKEVAVLPEDAIANMLAKNLINSVLKSENDNEEVEFEEGDNGELVYVVDGASQEKLFGLFNVYIPKKLKISAENGEVKNVEVSFFNQILDRFSF